MSADNGIYILQTRDQYRVIHSGSGILEGLTSSCVEPDFELEHPKKYVPTRVVEYFGNQQYTRDADTAYRVARAMMRSLPECEYGIKELLPYNKTWKHILQDAKNYARKELAELDQVAEDNEGLLQYAEACKSRLNDILNDKLK